METVVSIDEAPTLVNIIILMRQQNSNLYIKNLCKSPDIG